ncbi:hypothetical protein [Hoeflea sp.]|uniref:hypothetical protein n=1 Tax=Hoeflea sp. TaxID=1940281 RepID=UPI0032EBA73D
MRWLLGDEEALPLHDDTFAVTVRFPVKNEVFLPDGTRSEPGDDGPGLKPEERPASPRLFAMIDPPRRVVEIGRTPPSPEAPDGDPSYRMEAVEPTGPVDPAAPGVKGTLLKEPSDGEIAESHGVGVVHLLEESEPSRAEWRVAKALYPAMKRAAGELKKSRLGALASLESFGGSGGQSDPAEVSARAMARYISRSGRRPLDLPEVLTRAVTEFRSEAMGRAATGQAPRAMPEVFRLKDADLRAEIDHAALVSTAMNDSEAIETADREYSSRKQARQHLRLRALQGGELVDFWCDPDDGNATSCDVSTRGKRYSAAELIGNGLRIEGITSDMLTAWANAGDIIVVDVRHIPGEAERADVPLAGRDGERVGNTNIAEVQVASWTEGSTLPITPRDIRAALSKGSSFMPLPPTGAVLNFDLKHDKSVGATNSKEAGSEKEPVNTFTAETGDGKVQILIAGPTSDPDEATTVFSYNLYGVWEDAQDMEDLFEEGAGAFETAEMLERLKPFRISARYSFVRDLFPAFGRASGVAAVESILADPPWFPILRAPDASYDTSEPPASPGSDAEPASDGRVPLPPVAKGRMTAVTVDLRKGLDFDNPGMAGYQVMWDPFGRLETRWSPETDRVGQPLSTRPQRYRFWVTSVDAFDQESLPVAVRANDAEAGEADGYIYAPRYRTPLPPPRGIDGDTPKIAIDPATSELTVTWQTPLSERVGTDGAAGQKPLDKTQLKARVSIYRRRIKELIAEEVEMRPSEEVDLPQWADTNRAMREKGFAFWKAIDGIEPPNMGDIWSAGLQLKFKDRDHEYTAAISFAVDESWEGFWAPDVPTRSRTAISFELVDGEFQQRETRMAETPRVSDVSLCNVLSFSNTLPPRPAEGLALRFDGAKPVLPVDDVQRDLVLLRLLGHPIEGGEASPWLDTGLDLTEGQKLMCETALGRVRRQDGSPVDPASVRLFEARRLLATALTRPVDRADADENTDLRETSLLSQHPTLGFRGTASLSWTITPFESRPPTAEDESEAAAARIYQVRVPLTRREALAYATLIGDGTRQGDEDTLTYTLQNSKTRNVEALQAISNGTGEGQLGQPAAALLYEDDDTEPVLCRITGLDLTDSSRPMVTLDAPEGVTLESAQVLVFAAHALLERRVKDFDATFDDEVVLPVGGGLPEVFVWWCVTVSAHGTEASPGNRPSIALRASISIEPEAPSVLRVRPPISDEEALDVDNPDHTDFRPSSISDAGKARLNPRLVVSWTDPRPEVDALLVLYRGFEKINKEERQDGPSLEMLDAGIKPWEAIKLIEGLRADEPIPVELLTALGAGWLKGGVVAAPEEGELEINHRFIEPARGLRSTTGLVEIGEEGRPGFVDYYFSNESRQFEMEGSMHYRYRAARAIDLDPDGALGLGEEQRYLLSRITPWTPFYEPGNPSFQIMPGIPDFQSGPPLPPTAAPEVVFRFRTPETKLYRLQSLSTPETQVREWRYRIVLRRMIEGGIPSSQNEDYVPQWIEVGHPVELTYFSEGEAVIVDRAIDRAFPTDTPTFRYSIGVTQIAVIEDPVTKKYLGEVLVRRGSDNDGEDQLVDPFSLPPMLTGGSGQTLDLLAERRVTIRVLIK